MPLPLLVLGLQSYLEVSGAEEQLDLILFFCLRM